MTLRAAPTVQSYAGAKGKAPVDLTGYLIQPKVDGSYAELTTGDDGRVTQVTLRSGKPLTGNLAADYLGINLGAPRSTFAAELEIYTEAANRHAQARGWRALYIFDAIQLDGASLVEMSYETRHNALRAIQAAAQGQSPDRLPSDATGRLHDALGRFARDVPQGHRRYTILPLLPLAELESAWARFVTFEKGGPCEGLVAVKPSAKLGARASKLKLKRCETVDVMVESASRTRAVVRWAHGQFSVGCKGLALSPGETVEVAFDGGFYEGTMIPRFPRIVRKRPDLDIR